MKTTNIITGNYVLNPNAVQASPFKGIALISNYQQNQKAFSRIVNDILSVPSSTSYKQYEPSVVQEQLATNNEHQSGEQKQQQDSKLVKADNNQQNNKITSDEFLKIMEMYNNKQ